VVKCNIKLPPTPILPFVSADAQALPFASELFDGILAKDVLEHVRDVSVVLCKMRRVSRPGAKLVGTLPRAVPRAVWADPT
jgi:ubiquinone/menaquinone biosynthesis C-methylase UbiE